MNSIFFCLPQILALSFFFSFLDVFHDAKECFLEVSPPAKYFTQFASENSAAGKKKKKDASENLQVQQLKNIFKRSFQIELFNKSK